MKNIKAGLVDYGMGNLHSVAKALDRSGARVTVSSSPGKLRGCDVLVVPGVGSFGAAMRNLSRRNLDKFIRRWVQDGRPYLGICLGLQLLFERSDEDKKTRGLGLFKGRVVPFQSRDFREGTFRIPHMGWNQVRVMKKTGEKIFRGLGSDDSYYFVHSYFPAPKDKTLVLTNTPYGKGFCSSIQKGNLVATQFHPEKSGERGLRLLKNILTTIHQKAA